MHFLGGGGGGGGGGTIKQTTAGLKHEKHDPKSTCKNLHFSSHKEDIILDYFQLS